MTRLQEILWCLIMDHTTSYPTKPNLWTRPGQIDNRSYNVADQLCSKVVTIINDKMPMGDVSSYTMASGHDWDILVGADRGLGAWPCPTQLWTHSPARQRRFQNQSTDEQHRAQRDNKYYIFQSESITCKKDAPIILEKTVVKQLDDGWHKIKRSQLVVVWNKTDGRSLVKLVHNTWGTASLLERTELTFLAL
jgi:hypothetical protein